MFIYLSKKIAIPNNNKVRGLSWSLDHGFIACGGDDGLLKVLKLDSGESDGIKTKGLSAPKNLSMNQTLEGHNGAVLAVCWNEPYQKLTSSDQSGLIIVWMLYKGSWYEEMVNNRNKSVVRGMAWTFDGQKICIVYEDGAVIVGSVDGNRLWGKELKGMRLSQVEWSPDGKYILFGVLDTEVHVYDQNGNSMTKVPLPALQSVYGRNSGYTSNSSQVIGIKWHNSANGVHGYSSKDSHNLAIAFENGRIQLMKSECDDSPIIVDSELKITSICWNNSGTLLAVTGRVDTESDNKRNFVKFYNQSGDAVQTLKVPGKDIYSCSCEKNGLRMALAVDSYIFFANIRPDYNWCYFASTVAYSVNSAEANDEQGITSGPINTIIFWHIPSNCKYVKSVRNLLLITACGQYCVISAKCDETSANSKKKDNSSLIVCNAIGTTIDMISIEPITYFITMNSSRVIAASKDSFSIWRFTIPSSHCVTPKGFSNQKIGYSDVDLSGNDTDDDSGIKIIFVSRNDPIVCINASENYLIIGQESGSFQQYLLSSANVTHRFTINCVPSKLMLNKDASKLCVIDTNGTLYMYDFDANNGEKGQQTTGKLVEFERHDVWDAKWANDNIDMIAVTEKTKLFVFNIRTLESEEPIISSGYICVFDSLSIRTVLLDDLIYDAMNGEELTITKINDQIMDFETKSLREARKILDSNGFAEATNFIEQQSHPRLWHLLAESALNVLDLDTAEVAFVKCKDYKGIQFVKRLSQLANDSLKKAEVCAYNGNFVDAESIYIEMDRKDLAIQMRKILGDWHRIIDLLKDDYASNDDNQMRDALCNLGDYYADSHNWEEAVIHYEKCGAYDRLFECYAILENYDQLKYLVANFSDNHPILVDFGRTFESVGMCAEAVQSYLKARKVELAINCCVTMSEWKMAIDLAHEYNVPNIDSLLSKYAEHLMAKEKYFDIIELYRKANKIYEASTMLIKVIDETKKDKKADPLLMKKMYVLIGLLYEENQKLPSIQDKKTGTLNALLSDDSFSLAVANFKSLDDPWRGAEAYHFLILCQRQLYEGYFDSAMKTALHLRDYDDFIDCEEIYCLLALSSAANRSFSICSKAFIKLESSNTIQERRTVYEELAIAIFNKNPPKDSRNAPKSECTYCETMIPDWCTVCPSCHTKFSICVASGRPIMDSNAVWTCKRCAHSAYKADLVTFINCPLCHHNVTAK